MVRITRFRTGCEMRESRYWEREENRKYRICGWEEETWEHVVEICMGEGAGGGREEILKILSDDGKGEKWMRRLQERRKERRGRKLVRRENRWEGDGRERKGGGRVEG